jgi:hypothetical protein
VTPLIEELMFSAIAVDSNKDRAGINGAAYST